MSYINQPCAKLVLRFMDLPSGNTSLTTQVYNTAGWALNLRQQCGWTRINLRDVLGEMYDKYELFNIVCTSITSALGSTAIAASAEDRTATAFLSGLNFRNQGYDSANKVTTNKVMIGNVYYVEDLGTTVNGTITASPATFSKADGTTDLIITLFRNIDGAPCVQGTADFNFIFAFNIYGVKDDTLSHDNGRGKQSNNYLSNNYHN